MPEVIYTLNGSSISVDVEGDFIYGNSQCLSQVYNDLSLEQSWYKKGYEILSSHDFLDYEKMFIAVESLIRNILRSEGVNVGGFKLKCYHRYVDNNIHNKVIRMTRDIVPSMLDIDVHSLITKFSEYFAAELCWESKTKYEPKIIIRIIMPKTKHFNPVHKDIYQIYERERYIPQMINIWLPICGVCPQNKTGLAIAKSSHLIDESLIYRTKSGSTMNGIHYNVNCIASWNNENKLTTICPREGSFLIFSSHLIHGLGINNHEDITRVSLELRLFRKR